MPPYVIVIASEKGGVGKTTIATNLAVYLKALREDLPVTIASFDNHFSIDQMFALGPRPDIGVAGLLGDAWSTDAVAMGQFGVQYLASSRRLEPPSQQPAWLGRRLRSAGLAGVLILDTRPILDWFTEAAILAADLVLVPIKDRAALINASALQRILAGAGRSDRLWLLPSLVDARARLNNEIRVHEFLAFAARERGYQVLDLQISKSPKVESLSSGFSSRIMPVLTHARQTAVHGQFRKLAEFALESFDAGARPYQVEAPGCAGAVENPPVGTARRLIPECPVCCRRFSGASGHFFFDLRSRNRGFIHPDCMNGLLDGFELLCFDPEATGLIGLRIDGPGLVGPDPLLTAHLFDADGALMMNETLELEQCRALRDAISVMMNRGLEQTYRELLLIHRLPVKPDEQFTEQGMVQFRRLRRCALRELRQAGML